MMEFDVKDMTCGHCASVITKAVKEIDAGARCEIDLSARRVRIESTQGASEFGEAIREAGYSPVAL